MAVTYRNNRLVPAVIIAICIILVFSLIDPTVENFGLPAPKTTDRDATRAGAPPSAEPARTQSAGKPAVEPTRQVSHSEPSPKAPTTPQRLGEDDVLLIMKTGGTSMWKRLLVHLTTTLSGSRISPSNIVIYSDNAETIGSFTVVDALANMTDETKRSADFDVYRQQFEYVAHNYYSEAAGVDGDEWGPVGGWIIDKYKFIPLMEHAGRNWPHVKWYIYMEDDAYLFLPNIRKFLAGFDWRKNHYLGSYAAKSDAVFAHGGAGFVLSRGAWEASFGKNPGMVEKYHKYVAEHCCGDQVLGLALKDHGIRFGENGGDEKFTWGFNPLVHWTFAFSRSNWCHPLLSWHKVHNRDVARYYELEKSWNFDTPMLYRDFFKSMILPRIQKTAQWWDNMASLYEISSANREWAAVPKDGSKYDAALWKKAWRSVEACEAACRGWTNCAMWSFVEDLCKMDDKITMGQGYAPSMSQRKTSLMHTSGWMSDRLEGWKC
ncbi:glycosyltransferase family 31 protein [Purpureocillium lilacinum]|uniref:N-acetylgalactosaminide beta-1,3-galactosyltransferase n=1 Tax=Purpureocillium lilacinum TaxID=33203 RepID=A0A179HCH6_PURLI|nr:glycosyltransferase family 31 protein [Purpureocillium lilacinum]